MEVLRMTMCMCDTWKGFFGFDTRAEGPDLRKDPSYRNPNMCPSGRVFLKLCKQKVSFYIQDLSFERNVFVMKQNTFYYVPVMLGMGWYNNTRKPTDLPMLVLCFEVKTTYQSMEQTRECYVAPFVRSPHVQLFVHHMPWFSNDDFVDVVNRDMLPIYAGVERGGPVRLGVTGTHIRKLIAHHQLIQKTPDRRASDDEYEESDGRNDGVESDRKRKREDNDSTDSDFNQESPAMPNAKRTKVVENKPPKQDDYGNNDAATTGVPLVASMPINNNEDNDSDDSHAKKKAARRKKSAKSSAEPANEPPKNLPQEAKMPRKKQQSRRKVQSHLQSQQKNLPRILPHPARMTPKCVRQSTTSPVVKERRPAVA